MLPRRSHHDALAATELIFAGLSLHRYGRVGNQACPPSPEYVRRTGQCRLLQTELHARHAALVQPPPRAALPPNVRCENLGQLASHRQHGHHHAYLELVPQAAAATTAPIPLLHSASIQTDCPKARYATSLL